MDLIGRARRSLRRRIEASQAFHGVADELDADRLGVSRRKHVDDAAANGEGAVFVNRILARKARVDEQVGQSLRLDLRAGAKLDRGAQQAFLRNSRAEGAPVRRRRSVAPCRRPRREARGLAPPRRGNAASCRDTDRPESTEAAARPARPPPPTRLRGRRRRTARPPSSARRPDRSGRPAASRRCRARGADCRQRLAGWRQAGSDRRAAERWQTPSLLPSNDRSDRDGAVVVTSRLRGPSP